jgi:hypothetical protein
LTLFAVERGDRLVTLRVELGFAFLPRASASSATASQLDFSFSDFDRALRAGGQDPLAQPITMTPRNRERSHAESLGQHQPQLARTAWTIG